MYDNQPRDQPMKSYNTPERTWRVRSEKYDGHIERIDRREYGSR